MPHPSPALLDAHERLGVNALRALQLERLRATVRRAYDVVPHYRAAFTAAGLHPDDVRTLADLARVPFTTKADLRAAYPFGMLAVPRAQLARIHASTGTTGQPTIVGYTAGDVETWAQLVARSLRATGVRPGDLVHVAYGYGLFTGGLGLHYGAERLGCTVVPAGGGQTEKQVRLIADLRSDDMLIVRGVNVFPSQLEEVLLGDARCSPHWLVEVRRADALDELTLVGVSARVRAVAPGTLARSEGKARRVVDLRAAD